MKYQVNIGDESREQTNYFFQHKELSLAVYCQVSGSMSDRFKKIFEGPEYSMN